MSAPSAADACLVCGGTWGPARIAGLRACRTCGFVSADVTLPPAALAELYSARYFAGEEYRDYVAERPIIERQFRRRLARLARFVPDPANRRLFEVGAAYGFFLAVAREVFGDARGIDISEDAAREAREVFGQSVVTGEFLDAAIDGPLDVVCLWDTIEHLPRPDLYVEKAADLLAPGGLLAITTGDIGSVMARLRGARWRQIHPPTHLQYFSRRTLTRLLERHGFTVRHWRYEGMYRSVDTAAYIVLTIKHRRPRLYRALRRTGLLDRTLYLNLYDTLFLIAAKR